MAVGYDMIVKGRVWSQRGLNVFLVDQQIWHMLPICVSQFQDLTRRLCSCLFSFCSVSSVFRKSMQRNKQMAMGRKKFNMDPKKVRITDRCKPAANDYFNCCWICWLSLDESSYFLICNTSENCEKSKVTSFVLPNIQRYSVYYCGKTAKETNQHREFSFIFLKLT